MSTRTPRRVRLRIVGVKSTVAETIVHREMHSLPAQQDRQEDRHDRTTMGTATRLAGAMTGVTTMGGKGLAVATGMLAAAEAVGATREMTDVNGAVDRAGGREQYTQVDWTQALIVLHPGSKPSGLNMSPAGSSPWHESRGHNCISIALHRHTAVFLYR